MALCATLSYANVRASFLAGWGDCGRSVSLDEVGDPAQHADVAERALREKRVLRASVCVHAAFNHVHRLARRREALQPPGELRVANRRDAVLAVELAVCKEGGDCGVVEATDEPYSRDQESE